MRSSITLHQVFKRVFAGNSALTNIPIWKSTVVIHKSNHGGVSVSSETVNKGDASLRNRGHLERPESSLAVSLDDGSLQ